MALVDRTLAGLLELLAAREPAPGGGSAAAWAGALAAALTEMAAAFADGGHDQGGDRARVLRMRDQATELRVRLLELAERDVRSYAPVLEALALEHSDPTRAERLQVALSDAAAVPLEIAAAATEVAELAAAIAQQGNPRLLGDATAAAVLAEAGTRAATRLVELNLAASPRDARLGRAAALAARACAARTVALECG